MKRLKSITTLIVCILILSPIASFADSGDGYTIDHYEVTVELVPDSAGELRDAAVTLSITYNISGAPKSSGCKFIGQVPVKDVSTNDGNDKPLKFELEEFNEHKLTWHFPEVKQGQQTIVAHFTVVGALEGSLDENLVYFEWVEFWEAPVRDVVYRFILPENYTYEKLAMYPGNDNKQLTEYKGRRAVETHLVSLGDNALLVRFSPGIAEGASRPARRSILTQGCTTPTQQATNIVPGLIVAGLIIIIGIGFVSYVRWQARRVVRYGDAQVIAAASTVNMGDPEARVLAAAEAIQKSYDARPDWLQRLIDSSVQGRDRTGPMMSRIQRVILKVVLLSIAAFGAIGILGLLLGLRSVSEYSGLLITAGLLLALLGAGGAVKGGRVVRGRPGPGGDAAALSAYTLDKMEDDKAVPSSRSRQDRLLDFAETRPFALVGAIMFATGLLIVGWGLGH